MSRSPKMRFAAAIVRATNPSFLAGGCRITSDTSTVLERLGRSQKGGRARQIIEAALSEGYSDAASLHMAAIAAAESDFNPSITNSSSGAAGYFQMIPKYWSTAGSSATDGALKRQLRQLRSRYKDRVLNDLATLYATHFYLTLGLADRKFRTLGYQVSSKTYGQYVIRDSRGTTFHSPMIIAAYAVECFYDATGVYLDLDVPTIPSVVTIMRGGSDDPTQSYDLVAPFERIYDDIPKRFVISPAADAVNISRLDPILPSYDDAPGTDFSRIEWRKTNTISAIRIHGEGDEMDSGVVDPLRTDDVGRTTILQSSENIIFPSFDCLSYALRTKGVSIEILKQTILSVCCSSSGFLTRFEYDQKGKFGLSRGYRYFVNNVLSDEVMFSFFKGLGTDGAFKVLSTCLHKHLQSSSNTSLLTQISFHGSVGVEVDLSGSEDENFNDTWFFTWPQYVGVLYPFSLLVTPNFGVSRTRTRLSVSQKYAQSLIDWARDYSEDAGSELILSYFSARLPNTLTD